MTQGPVKPDEAEVLVRWERLRKRMEEANRDYPDEEVETDLKEVTALLRARKRRSRNP